RSQRPAPPAALAVSWLGADQRSAEVLRTARAMLDVEAVLQGALPRALAHGCRVARLDRQALTLAVPSAPYAAKLRQLTPRLIATLNGQGWNLNQIIVTVQADLLRSETKSALREALPLDERALQAFDALKANVRPGPLASAIERLLQHHRS